MNDWFNDTAAKDSISDTAKINTGRTPTFSIHCISARVNNVERRVSNTV